MRRLDESIMALIKSLFFGLAGATLGSIVLLAASTLLTSPFIDDTNPAFAVVTFWAAGLGAIAGFCLGVNHGVQRARTNQGSRLTAR
jgi:hypothetical protein